MTQHDLPEKRDKNNLSTWLAGRQASEAVTHLKERHYHPGTRPDCLAARSRQRGWCHPAERADGRRLRLTHRFLTQRCNVVKVLDRAGQRRDCWAIPFAQLHDVKWRDAAKPACSCCPLAHIRLRLWTLLWPPPAYVSYVCYSQVVSARLGFTWLPEWASEGLYVRPGAPD